ncbi:MAG TPA: Ger(x)C family spore germination protein [Bacillota bacterium]
MTRRFSQRRLIGLALILALLAILPLVVSGCWDYVSITQRALVLAIGIDKGEADRYEVTLQIALPAVAKAAGGTSGGSQGPDHYEVSADADTFGGALARVQAVVAREIFLGQARVVIFGEDLARDGLEPLMMELARAPEVDKTANFVVARESRAKDILKTPTPLGRIPALALNSTFESARKRPETIRVRLIDFFIRTVEPGQDEGLPTTTIPGPLPSSGDATVDVGGTSGGLMTEGFALFKDYKMVGWLDRSETEALLFLLGRANDVKLAVGEPKKGEYDEVRRVTVKRKLKVFTGGGQVRFQLDIHCTGEVAATRAEGLQVSRADIERIRAEVKQEVAAKTESVLAKLKELGTDPLGLGSVVFYHDPDLWARLNWDEVYPTVPVEIKVDVRLVRKGLIN